MARDRQGNNINLRCPWILVTNIRQTRLYYKGADEQTNERFDTEALAADERQLKKFVYLLHANRVVPAHGPCHLDAWLQDSEKIGREVTRELYAEYAFIRRSTLYQLRLRNPDVEPRLVLACAQKLLDRILFIAFCEDRGLLPSETIKRAYRHRDPYNPRPVWENFRGMFRAINMGSDELDIRKYNGGLFADDPVLDALKIPDGVFSMFDSLAEYDFRPASAFPDRHFEPVPRAPKGRHRRAWGRQPQVANPGDPFPFAPSPLPAPDPGSARGRGRGGGLEP